VPVARPLMCRHLSATMAAMLTRLVCPVILSAAVAVGVGCAERAPDAANALPFGFLDSPSPGAPVARVTRVAGWALDDGAVRRVDVYVDGRFVGSATPALSRPDVAAAFPGHPGGSQAGWELPVDLGTGSQPREILAQAVDDRGATRDIGVASVTVVPRP
jgi:hypothetical protein